MDIKLHIKKLGKIRDAEIVISPLTIFYGDSGLGKSYLAMLVYYFYAILWDKSTRFTEFFKEKGFVYKKMVSSFRGEGVALRFSKKELERWMAQDALVHLRYLLKNDDLDGDFSVELPQTIDEEIEFRYKEELTGLVNEDDVSIILSSKSVDFRVGNKDNNDIIDDVRSPFAFLLGVELIESLFGKFDDFRNAFCLPPSRGLLLTENVFAKTGLVNDFSLQKYRLEKANELKQDVSNYLIDLMHQILEGDVRQSENGEYSYYTHDYRMPLSAAAASIREIAPLFMIASKTNVSKISLLFEEPEAHLHPLKQRMIADVVSAFVSSGASLQITTHSDYFLRRLNELILMSKLKEKNAEKFSKFCQEYHVSESLALDFRKIKAYYLYEDVGSIVRVECQNLENGIPFTSFHEAIESSFKIQSKLNDELLDDSDNNDDLNCEQD